MKRIFDFFSSTKLTLVLLALFAFAQARGTFIENDYGTPAAKAFIYGAWWFEALMALLAVNFALNIKKYGLWRRPKWPILLFHLGFIVTILGAFVTRYTGFEGTLNIREGESKDYLLSEYNYLTVWVDDQWVSEKITATALTTPSFSEDVGTDEVSAHVEITDYVSGAEEVIEEGPDHILHIVIAEANARADYYLVNGDIISSPLGTIGFNSARDTDVKIMGKEGDLSVSSKVSTEFMTMATSETGVIATDSIAPLRLATLYRSGNLSFVVSSSHPHAKVTYKASEDAKKAKNLPGKLLFAITSQNETKELALDVAPGRSSGSQINLGGTDVIVQVAPRKIPMGFSLKLDDFVLIRYPGSTSPSEYSSYLTVIDGETTFPYHIFMNNVLDYNGFRFFQASYDNDELGTVLSVNHDWWGTWITYLGYFMLFGGMMWSLFAKNARFHYLNESLKRIKEKKAALVGLLAFVSIASFGQSGPAAPAVDRVAAIYPKPTMEVFGGLLVQDMDGRIKPVNTLASELARKLTGKTKFHLDYDSTKLTLDANQLFFAIHQRPQFWIQAPMVKIDTKKGQRILEILNADPQTEYLSGIQFFDDEGNYILESEVETAHQAKPSARNQHMEEVIKVDERFNILYQALTDSYVKIFPRPGDPDNKWFSNKSFLMGFEPGDSNFVKNIFPLIQMAADTAYQTGDWSSVERLFGYIGTFQQTLAKDIVPSESRVKAELFYNKAKIYLHLFYSYWMVGVLLLLLAIFQLFTPSKGLVIARKIGVSLAVVLFLFQTLNLILRWYIADYPPWSNGYEMIILVSWATVLFGILYNKRTQFILPLSTLFAGTLLFVAFLDWLNPEITNLVPVLKSYWLKIHVAIIVGSYAPLALCALLGFTAMWLKITTRKENERVSLSLRELTLLNEASMTIGLYMLTIGTFLGGIWANESWGRYWGWDPKETWALISIMVYAIVLHLRLVPALSNSFYWFNATSVLAFGSIVMTSFGVNYYLTGLHSYATGDPVPIPIWVYYAVAIILGTLVWGYFASRRKVLPPNPS